MDIRHVNEDYTNIANELIRTEPDLKYIRESNARIIYLESELEKKSNGRLIHGQCEKVPDKYKWGLPCDFMITIFKPNVERFTDDQMRILILHELMHVGITIDGNEETYSIVPHDYEDFRMIIERYGIDWSVAE